MNIRQDTSIIKPANNAEGWFGGCGLLSKVNIFIIALKGGMKHISSLCNWQRYIMLTLRYTVYTYIKCMTSLKKCKTKHCVSKIKGGWFIISLLRFPFGQTNRVDMFQTEEHLNDKTKSAASNHLVCQKKERKEAKDHLKSSAYR